MRKRLFIGCIVLFLAGCGNTSDIKETETTSKEESTQILESTEKESVVETIEETTHEHNFIETITKDVTCLENGEKVLSCECGETQTEIIEATGHSFEKYVSNEDASYTADGTETATCVCGETDTRVAEGSMLTYTYEEMDVTKYAKDTVNVRSLPDSEGEKLGGLSQNEEVKVTGKCLETGWYRIEYKDSVAYVSDSYLVDKKTEVSQNTTSDGNSGSSSSSSNKNFPTYTSYDEVKAYAISLGYPIGSATDNGDGTYLTYFIVAVDSSNVQSWDFEYEARLADLEASRHTVETLSGQPFNRLEKYGKPIMLAHTADSNYEWKLNIGKW